MTEIKKLLAYSFRCRNNNQKDIQGLLIGIGPPYGQRADRVNKIDEGAAQNNALRRATKEWQSRSQNNERRLEATRDENNQLQHQAKASLIEELSRGSGNRSIIGWSGSATNIG